MSFVVLPLDSPDVDLASAGGKAAMLSVLLRAGFPVPPGFVSTTAAYSAFASTAELERGIAEVERLAGAGDPDALTNAARDLRELIASTPVPAEMASAICQAYRALGRTSGHHDGLAVAVRSSATAEDLPDASFAGQQETFLNVRGEEDLLRAVRRCWASPWTDRAIAYRRHRGLGHAAVSLAVVVQVLVQADAAGVLFTTNPISGDSAEVVINAAWGLGETVVGGAVNPDTVLADKESGRVRLLETGEKMVMSAPTESGTALVEVPSERRMMPVLTAEQVGELVRLGRNVEVHLGAPQDIEWAIANGQVFLLQARPIRDVPGT